MKKRVALSLLFVLAVFITNALGADVTLLGPSQYVRTSGGSDLYTNTFSGVAGEGRLVVKNGNQDGDNRITDAISSAVITVNGVEIFSQNDFNQNVYLLEAPVNLSESNTISVELWSSPGSYLTVEVIEDIDPPTLSLSANPETISPGESSTLSWSSTYADSAIIDNDIGTVSTSGTISVSPTETTTYTITVTGIGGSISSSVTVTVQSLPPTVSFSTDPKIIPPGDSSILSWTSTYAESVTIDQDIGTVATSGSMEVSPTETTTYTITATGPGGTASSAVTVTVSYQPTVSISANPETIILGQSATLTWTATYADSVTIDQNIGSVATSGSMEVSPSTPTAYTITADGPGGRTSTSVTVSVSAAATPLKAIISHTYIDTDLQNFPVLIRLTNNSGINGFDVSPLLNELMDIDPNDSFSSTDGGAPSSDRWTTSGSLVTIQNDQLDFGTSNQSSQLKLNLVLKETLIFRWILIFRFVPIQTLLLQLLKYSMDSLIIIK